MVWKVVGEIWDFQQNRFVSLSSLESNTAVTGDCLVDFAGRRVDPVTYVAGGTREQAKHRAGKEFHDVDYSKADLWQDVAKQTGFYDSVWEKRVS